MLFNRDHLLPIYTVICMIIFLRIIILSFQSHQIRTLSAGLRMAWNRAGLSWGYKMLFPSLTASSKVCLLVSGVLSAVCCPLHCPLSSCPNKDWLIDPVICKIYTSLLYPNRAVGVGKMEKFENGSNSWIYFMYRIPLWPNKNVFNILSFHY